jgi:hypothetical protein
MMDSIKERSSLDSQPLLEAEILLVKCLAEYLCPDERIKM